MIVQIHIQTMYSYSVTTNSVIYQIQFGCNADLIVCSDFFSSNIWYFCKFIL